MNLKVRISSSVDFYQIDTDLIKTYLQNQMAVIVNVRNINYLLFAVLINMMIKFSEM